MTTFANNNFKSISDTNNKKYIDALKMANKEMGTSIIATMIQHMWNKTDIDRRSYLITIHLNSWMFKYNQHRHPISQDYFNRQLYNCITRFIYKKPKVPKEEQIGLLIAQDANGSRSGKNIDAPFGELPHLHCLLILPFEISDIDLQKRFVALLAKEIHKLDGVKKSKESRRTAANGFPHVQVKSFTDKKPLWFVADYAIKSSKNGNTANGDYLDYAILPFDFFNKRISYLKQKNASTSINKSKNRGKATAFDEIFMKSIKLQKKEHAAKKTEAKILSNRDSVEAQMRLRPSDFYFSPVCRDITEYQQKLYFKGITQVNQVSNFQDLNLKKTDLPRVHDWVYRCLPEQVSSENVPHPAPAENLYFQLGGYWQ